MVDALYQIGVQLSLETSAFGMAARSAMDAFKQIEQAATSANKAVDAFAPRVSTSFGALEQSAGRVQTAFSSAQASMAQLAAATGAPSTVQQAAQDAHLRNLGALSTAQADLSTKQAAYNALLAEQAVAMDKAAAAQGKLSNAQRGATMLAAGGAATAAGAFGLSMLRGAVGQAQQMQDQLVQVGQAARGTPRQLQDLYNQSFNVAGVTQFSAPQVLSMEQMMARMGFRDLTGQMTQRQVIAQAIPEFARAAEIEAHFSGASAQQTVEALTMHAHQFGVYSGPQLASLVSMAIGANMASGMTLQQQSNVLRYLQPAIKGLHMAPEDAYALAALSNETGLSSGRGGSNLGALFRYMMPIGSKTQRDALADVERLGGGDFFKNGQFVGVGRALDIINTFMRSPGLTDQQRQTDLVDAFRVQGAQAASLLGNNTAIKQFQAIAAQIATYTPDKLQRMQEQLNQTFVGQMTTLRTNFQSLSAILGRELIPELTGFVSKLNDLLRALIPFAEQHPMLVRTVALFAGLATAIGLIGGPILMAAGAFALLVPEGVALGVAFGTAGVALGVFVGGLAAFALLIADWNNVMDATSGTMHKVSFWTAALTELLAALFAPLIGFYRILQGIADILPGFHQKPSSTTAAGVPPPHKGDVLVNGVWYLPNGKPDTAAQQVAQARQQAQANGHTIHFTQNIHVGAGDAHHIAAVSAQAAKKALKDLSGGFALDANYGGYGFTSNPTLRSGGW